MHITTILENSPGKEGLVSEHGLSMGLSVCGTEVLFDTGPSKAFSGNASLLGYDLEKVDLAVLSHGHFDHGGGLEEFFERNSKARLFLGQGAGGEFYAERGSDCRYIGLDQGMLRKNGGRMRWVKGPISIDPHIHLITSFPLTYARPAGNSALREKVGGELVQDTFGHELAMVVNEDDGIAIFTGCGHSGVLNMVLRVKSLFPNERIKAVVGGFHLTSDPARAGISGSADEVREIGREMVRLGCSAVFGGHCTGRAASDLLGQELGDAYHELHTGLVFDI